jgi:hypothetical protein
MWARRLVLVGPPTLGTSVRDRADRRGRRGSPPIRRRSQRQRCRLRLVPRLRSPGCTPAHTTSSRSRRHPALPPRPSFRSCRESRVATARRSSYSVTKCLAVPIAPPPTVAGFQPLPRLRDAHEVSTSGTRFVPDAVGAAAGADCVRSRRARAWVQACADSSPPRSARAQP